MAVTQGFHGNAQTLTTDDTYETIFDASTVSNIPKRGIRGIEIWCTGVDAEVLIDPISQYGTNVDNSAPIIAGNSAAQFYGDSIRKVQIKQSTVSGSTVSWRTIVN